MKTGILSFALALLLIAVIGFVIVFSFAVYYFLPTLPEEVVSAEPNYAKLREEILTIAEKGELNESDIARIRELTSLLAHHSPPTTIIEQGSGVETANYIIFGVDSDGDGVLDEIYAKNGLTGEIEFSGTNASKVIQSAIDALGVEGGKIFVREGTYVINTKIIIRKGIIFEGISPYATVLKAGGGFTDYILEIESNYGEWDKRSAVKNLKIDSAGIGTSSGGIHIVDHFYPLIDFVNIYAFTGGAGIVIEDVSQFSEGWTIRNTQIRACDIGIHFKHGAGTGSMAYGWVDAKIAIGTPSGRGVQIDNGLELSRSHFYLTIWLDYSAQTGMYVDGIITDSILTVTFEGLVGGETPTALSLGPNGWMANNMLVQIRTIGGIGSAISNPYNRPIGMAIMVGDEIRIYYNYVTKMLEIPNAGGLTLYSDNFVTRVIELQGWTGKIRRVTANFGIATQIADGAYIAHGLTTIPSAVLLTSLNATYGMPAVPVIVSWDQVLTNSTHFRTRIYWANGTAITDPVIAVSWYAEV